MSSFAFKYTLKCPYCGMSLQGRTKKHLFEEVELDVCDPEDGGCDKRFVVTTHISVKVTATARKIEGEEDGA